MGNQTSNMSFGDLMAAAKPSCTPGPCAIFSGFRKPCSPLNGCCHVGACCEHSTCWTGLLPAAWGGVALLQCSGQMPCNAYSCFCMHGGCGLHKVLECELRCAELKCHKEGELGCAPDSPKFQCNTGLVKCDEDYTKHFCCQCGICCCHTWCSRQACLGHYCTQPSAILILLGVPPSVAAAQR